MGTLLGFKRKGNGVRVSVRGGRPVVEEDFECLVKADSKNESHEDLYLKTPGLPQIGEQSGVMICASVDLKRDPANAEYYHANVRYSSDVEESSSTGGSGGSDFNFSGDPTTWRPVYETRFERLQEVVTEDRNNNPIVNSAGQHFQTGLTVSRFIPIWSFYQFEPVVSDETIIERNEVVNLVSFKGRDPKTLLLIIESSVVQFYYGQRRRLTHYSLKYNDRKWTHKRLDIGTYYLDSGSRKTFTTDDTGAAIAGPLNGSGGKASTSADVATLEFDVYEQVDFNGFLYV